MNLWPSSPHLNEDSWIQIKAQAATWKPPHRFTDRAILSYLRHWLLADYVFPYCLALETSRIFRRCYWIDTAGYYNNQDLLTTNKEEITHSKRRSSHTSAHAPALDPIFTQVQKLEKNAVSVKLHSLTLIKAREKKSQIEIASTKAEQIIPTNGIIQASWQEMARPILQTIEQSPAIFLLDPLQPQLYGPGDLQLLYQRTVPTEICLVVLYKQIEQRLNIARNNQEDAKALSALLRSTKWRQLPSEKVGPGQPSIPNETTTGFIDLMTAAMRPYFQIAPVAISFPLISGPATIRNAPLTLLYTTRKPESLLIMNDAICHYQRRTYKQSYEHVLGNEWFAQQEEIHRKDDQDQLARQIQQTGKTTRARRWSDLRQRLILSQFGRFTQEEYNQAIHKLIETQHVHCQWRQPPIQQEKEPIPGIHDILIWS